MLKKTKAQGITLIALVVTIIVLLILAGVTIYLISGSEGILNKATASVDKTYIEIAKEQVTLKIVEYQSEFYEGKYVTFEIGSEFQQGDWIYQNYEGKTQDYEFTIKLPDGKNQADMENPYVVTINQNEKLKKPVTGTLSVTGKLHWEEVFNNDDGSEEKEETLEITAITVEDMEVEKGRSKRLKITTVPDTTNIEKLKYTSSDETIATVDENGRVKGISEGTTTITVTGSISTNISDSCTITVIGEVPTIGEGAFDNDENTYEVVQNGVKRIYISEDLYGQTIAINLQTKYGRGTNSTSIYFYDLEGEKIEDAGELFYHEGGTIKTGVCSYKIPENCSYVEFWAGDGPYGPYIFLYEIQMGMNVEISVDLKAPIIKDNTIDLGSCMVNLKPEKNIVKMKYKIDDNEWTDYTETLKITGGKTIYAKGIDKNGNESLAISSDVFPCFLSRNIIDGDDSTYDPINTGENARIYVSPNVYGKNININLITRYGRGADFYGAGSNATCIYFYDLEGQKIEDVGTKFEWAGGTTTANIYSYTIPEGCSYIEFWVGDGSYGPFMYLCEISIE